MQENTCTVTENSHTAERQRQVPHSEVLETPKTNRKTETRHNTRQDREKVLSTRFRRISRKPVLLALRHSIDSTLLYEGYGIQ